jgi:hypothetical protein
MHQAGSASHSSHVTCSLSHLFGRSLIESWMTVYLLRHVYGYEWVIQCIIRPSLFCIYAGALLPDSDASLDFRLLGPWRSQTILCCWRHNAQYKYKCLTIHTNRYTNVHMPQLPVLQIGGNLIESIDKWLHLGYVINDVFQDHFDILACRNSLFGQLNNCLCNFSIS